MNVVFGKKSINRISLLMVIMLAACLVTSCGNREKVSDSDLSNSAVPIVYYITPDIDGVIPLEADFEISEDMSMDELLGQYVMALSSSPDPSKYVAPLGEESGFSSALIKDNQAIADFDPQFLSLDPVFSTLIRAAVTRTITRIPGVDAVSATVEGQQLLNREGLVIGALGADSFIDNAGLQINADERTSLTLYFANEEGDKLIKVNRKVVYSGNISMDKLVLSQLLAGPQEGENAYPVLNPVTRVINVTTQDGTCYVNLDSTFLSPVYNISNDVAIYSIVNSLSELGTVNRVQFMIDSDSDVTFRETIDLNTQFVRNLDVVE